MWNWLRDPNNQGALKIIGGAIAAVVVAGWAYFQWYQSRPGVEKPPIIVNVCRGEFSNRCPPFDTFVNCGDGGRGVDHIRDQCKSLTHVTTSSVNGDKCGYMIYRYTCVQK